MRLDTLKTRRDMYLEAEAAILTGQSYRQGTFSLTRADLGRVQAAIKELDQEIGELESHSKGKRCTFQIMPRDV